MTETRRPSGCWVILAGTTPTSFRARDRETLLPTFRQLQRTQADVALKWFERRQLWESPAAARDALLVAHQTRRPGRKSDWRPGGEHKDPRARFELSRDQKRAKFKTRLRQNGPAGPVARRSAPPRGPKGSK